MPPSTSQKYTFHVDTTQLYRDKKTKVESIIEVDVVHIFENVEQLKEYCANNKSYLTWSYTGRSFKMNQYW